MMGIEVGVQGRWNPGVVGHREGSQQALSGGGSPVEQTGWIRNQWQRAH